jgi:methylated-DNA-[protein]-cysteine S-methyltransferase
MTSKKIKILSEHKAYYSSPIGTIEIVASELGITSLNFAKDSLAKSSSVHSCLKDVLVQVDEYFKGKRRKFSLKLILQGTDFQKKVWRELLKIPYGKTASYRDVAAAVGREKAARAVGNANRLNNIAIIIPCHRVIGSRGELVGYGGGLWRKKWLLEHEHKFNADKNKRK